MRTPAGRVAIERIGPGDLVETLDSGQVPVREIVAIRMSAQTAPPMIDIAAGTFGPHAALSLAPGQEVLLCSWVAELLFGEFEVLVRADDLCDDRLVSRGPGQSAVIYLPVFDQPQILFCGGLACASALPRADLGVELDQEANPQEPARFDPHDIANDLPHGRPVLERYEAQVLTAETDLACAAPLAETLRVA